jgi:LysM repeat protein
MPYLNDVFINVVYSEDVKGTVKTTDHPVEEGIDVTDHIKKDPEQMRIAGIITGPDASVKMNRLKNYQNSGELLRYSYRNIFTNVIIVELNRIHDADVKGGFKFDITLKEIKIAKSAIVKTIPSKKTQATTTKGLQQPKGTTPAKIYVVKQGDTLTKIANQYNVNLQKLYEKNRGVIGDNPNLIYAGQKLTIPA